MHDEILRYSLEGKVSDHDVVKRREELLSFVDSQMRDEGVARSIDVDPQFTVNYNPETEEFDFALSVYGVYVGSGEVCQTSGVMSGKKIMKPTPQTKSKQS